MSFLPALSTVCDMRMFSIQLATSSLVIDSKFREIDGIFITMGFLEGTARVAEGSLEPAEDPIVLTNTGPPVGRGSSAPCLKALETLEDATLD
jgi:hypothetical protein